MDKIKLFTNEIFKLLVIVITISSILITIITNFDIDPYIKYFIIPTIILISCFLIIMKKIKLIFNKKAYYLFIPIFLILCSYLIIDIDMSNDTVVNNALETFNNIVEEFKTVYESK